MGFVSLCCLQSQSLVPASFTTCLTAAWDLSKFPVLSWCTSSGTKFCKAWGHLLKPHYTYKLLQWLRHWFAELRPCSQCPYSFCSALGIFLDCHNPFSPKRFAPKSLLFHGVDSHTAGYCNSVAFPCFYSGIYSDFLNSWGIRIICLL